MEKAHIYIVNIDMPALVMLELACSFGAAPEISWGEIIMEAQERSIVGIELSIVIKLDRI